MTDLSKLAPTPGFYRFKVGSIEVIALHEGVLSFDRPPGLVRNASDEDVGEAYAVAGMPREKMTITFNALLVGAAKGWTLIDTGFGASAPPSAGFLSANMQAAGVRAEDIDAVIISHFHVDHISGLRRADGGYTYPNAEICVPDKEWAFWMDDARMNGAPEALKDNFALCRKIFDPAAKQLRRYQWGEEILPGLTAIDVHGHTPGMSGVRIASGAASALFVADITNNPLIFARHPEWQLSFDMDGEAAVQTRKKILDQAVADKTRLSFFHAPFPATGYVVKSGAGYDFLPALWTTS